MQSKYYAVLDTNVLVSALLGATRMSTPTRVLKAVTENKLIVLYNDEIIEEYRAVLSRKKFSFSATLIEDLLNMIVTNGIKLDRTTAIDEIFPDPKDIVFYEVSLSKKGSYLVTGNLKHFPQKSFVISPADMLQLLCRE